MNQNIPAEFLIKLLQLQRIGRQRAIDIISKSNYQIETDKDLIHVVQNQSICKLPDYSEDDFEKAFRNTQRIIDKSEELGIKIISYLDSSYPKLLKKISKFPVVLYYKGNINILSEMPALAIIGTRNASELGLKYGHNLSMRCAELGFNIVSGLAKGCDTVGHQGALDANGITTAVLAHGLDRVYPKENKYLADKILASNGLLVSEYYVSQQPLSNFFVERDRIQAGLSLGTIVIETDTKGGSMHTVKYTSDSGRRVACINFPDDSSIYLNNEGNKMLINNRTATPITNKDDLPNFLNTLKKDYEIILKNEQNVVNNELFSPNDEKVAEPAIKYNAPNIIPHIKKPGSKNTSQVEEQKGDTNEDLMKNLKTITNIIKQKTNEIKDLKKEKKRIEDELGIKPKPSLRREKRIDENGKTLFDQ